LKRIAVLHVEEKIVYPSVTDAARHLRFDRSTACKLLRENPSVCIKPGIHLKKVSLEDYPLNSIVSENGQPDVFKDIPGYEGLFAISQRGKIKSLKFKGRLKKPTVNQNGQRVVVLYKDNVPKMFTIETLLRMTFEGGGPKKTNFRNHHKKGIKCLTDGKEFESVVECCKHYRLSYKDFRQALSEQGDLVEFGGRKFQLIKEAK